MELKKEFEDLLALGLKSPEDKKKVIQMSAYLINCLSSLDKKELSKEELNKISAGNAERYFYMPN